MPESLNLDHHVADLSAAMLTAGRQLTTFPSSLAGTTRVDPATMTAAEELVRELNKVPHSGTPHVDGPPRCEATGVHPDPEHPGRDRARNVPAAVTADP